MLDLETDRQFQLTVKLWQLMEQGRVASQIEMKLAVMTMTKNNQQIQPLLHPMPMRRWHRRQHRRQRLLLQDYFIASKFNSVPPTTIDGFVLLLSSKSSSNSYVVDIIIRNRRLHRSLSSSSIVVIIVAMFLLVCVLSGLSFFFSFGEKQKNCVSQK